MTDWKEYKIKEIGEIITGKTPSSKNPEQWGHEIPFVTPTDFDSYNKNITASIRYLSSEGVVAFQKKVLPEDSIIVTCIGSQMGKVAINKVKCVTNQQINSIAPYRSFNSDFIYYVLTSLNEYLRNLATGGSTMPIVNKSAFEDISLRLPPLPTQTAIAEILSSLDDKIELNNQINQNLEALSQALFKQWFVDFEFPNENGEPYKSSGGEMVDSELGEIPSGWEITKIRSLGKVITGKTPSIKNPHHFGTLIPFVTPSDFKTYFKLILSAERGLSEEGEIAFKKNILPKNSVIVTCIGSDMGKVAVNREDCLTNQQINSIVFNLEHSITCEYTYYYLKSIYSELKNLATGGSTMPIINKSQFEDISILNPDSKLLLKFTDQIKQFDTMIEANIRKNENLILLRDILLPKLISGEMEVKEAMEQIS